MPLDLLTQSLSRSFNMWTMITDRNPITQHNTLPSEYTNNYLELQQLHIFTLRPPQSQGGRFCKLKPRTGGLSKPQVVK